MSDIKIKELNMEQQMLFEDTGTDVVKNGITRYKFRVVDFKRYYKLVEQKDVQCLKDSLEYKRSISVVCYGGKVYVYAFVNFLIQVLGFDSTTICKLINKYTEKLNFISTKSTFIELDTFIQFIQDSRHLTNRRVTYKPNVLLHSYVSNSLKNEVFKYLDTKLSGNTQAKVVNVTPNNKDFVKQQILNQISILKNKKSYCVNLDFKPYNKSDNPDYITRVLIHKTEGKTYINVCGTLISKIFYTSDSYFITSIGASAIAVDSKYNIIRIDSRGRKTPYILFDDFRHFVVNCTRPLKDRGLYDYVVNHLKQDIDLVLPPDAETQLANTIEETDNIALLEKENKMKEQSLTDTSLAGALGVLSDVAFIDLIKQVGDQYYTLNKICSNYKVELDLTVKEREDIQKDFLDYKGKTTEVIDELKVSLDNYSEGLLKANDENLDLKRQLEVHEASKQELQAHINVLSNTLPIQSVCTQEEYDELKFDTVPKKTHIDLVQDYEFLKVNTVSKNEHVVVVKELVELKKEYSELEMRYDNLRETHNLLLDDFYKLKDTCGEELVSPQQNNVSISTTDDYESLKKENLELKFAIKSLKKKMVAMIEG